MPKPPIKSTRALSEAAEYGKLEAFQKMRRKKHKFTVDSILLSAREHFGKLIDTMTFENVVDMVAAIGLTVVIHDAIQKIPNIVTTLSKVTYRDEIIAILGGVNLVSSLGSLFGSLMGDWFLQVVQPTPTPAPIEKPPEDIIPAALGWLLSFSIAWCIVKWGDKLLSGGIATLPAIIGLLTAV